MSEKLYALALNRRDSNGNTLYKVKTMPQWEQSLDWIVLEVLRGDHCFKEVVLKDDKYYRVN